MKMKIKNIGNGKISIDSPYNPDFVAKIKGAGGRWNPSDKTWEIDERSLEAVRAIMREVYGQDDLPTEKVSVKITIGADSEVYEDRGPVVLFGRVVASARGRDSGARLGDGVSFEAGGAHSGGSMKNWYTYIGKESVFTIYDVPRLAVERKLGWEDDYGTFEVLENGNQKAALEAEKEALLKRLAEIEELMNA